MRVEHSFGGNLKKITPADISKRT